MNNKNTKIDLDLFTGLSLHAQQVHVWISICSQKDY